MTPAQQRRLEGLHFGIGSKVRIAGHRYTVRKLRPLGDTYLDAYCEPVEREGLAGWCCTDDIDAGAA